jgi:CheY-like chemotaxis protein
LCPRSCQRAIRKCFAFLVAGLHLGGVTQPLALVYFQRPLPGNQLVNRLQDLNYRVRSVGSAAELATQSKATGVMLVLADVEGAGLELIQKFRVLREDEATRHLPIVAFADSQTDLDAAQTAGSTMAVDTTALLAHLSVVLDQALSVD